MVKRSNFYYKESKMRRLCDNCENNYAVKEIEVNENSTQVLYQICSNCVAAFVWGMNHPEAKIVMIKRQEEEYE